ncbi:DinB family protein [Tamlana sp. 2201CG12-4]|uniref:DinB family protein n=1 Tax=Tamlana sp. 2201CG12-4 TaxID=3112582 RepID=UPI002DB8CC97|nr:DinB family protein [Tamlana sp. 2201CG12-4]MEC3905938.1 DinB family protein [Tamlana sp. 2201CG12-4]
MSTNFFNGFINDKSIKYTIKLQINKPVQYLGSCSLLCIDALYLSYNQYKTMAIQYIIDQLEHNIKTFESLLSNKTEENYLWRSHPEKWCLLEIVCHLLDEEQEDFRARVKHTLETPSKDLIPIDPVGWVKARHYLSKSYHTTLLKFLDERRLSVAWLNSLKNANWDNALVHPKLGTLSARLFLENWLAHDYLHIRQIIRYQYNYLKEKGTTNLQYAGNW